MALVTGGARGIGQAIAERLNGDGFKVAIADLRMELAEALAKRLGGGEGGAIALKTDVSKRDDVCAAVEAAREAWWPRCDDQRRGHRADFTDRVHDAG